jgi:hypothetical protein
MTQAFPASIIRVNPAPVSTTANGAHHREQIRRVRRARYADDDGDDDADRDGVLWLEPFQPGLALPSPIFHQLFSCSHGGALAREN